MLAPVVDQIGGEAVIAVQTHDDMGVATANAAAGVAVGATSVDATVGGSCCSAATRDAAWSAPFSATPGSNRPTRQFRAC